MSLSAEELRLEKNKIKHEAQALFGQIEDTIDNNSQGQHIFNVIGPLWGNRALLSAQEKSMVYCIGILAHQVQNLEQKVLNLEKINNVVPQAGGKRSKSKKNPSKSKAAKSKSKGKGKGKSKSKSKGKGKK